MSQKFKSSRRQSIDGRGSPDDGAGAFGGVQLAALLYLLFFAMGSVTIPLVTILTRSVAGGGLGLGPGEVAAVTCGTAIAPMLALPLVAALEARSTCRRRLIGGLCTIAAALAATLAVVVRSSPAGPVPVLAGIACALGAANSAALALAFAAVLAHLGERRDQFFRFRSAATAGYISAGLALGFGVRPVSPQPFVLACAGYALAAAFTVSALPQLPVPPRPPEGTADIGLRRLAGRCGPALLAQVFGCFIVARLFDVYGNAFLTELPAVPRPAAVQMVAQSLELVMLWFMPGILRTMPHRHLLLLGPAGWLGLYSALALAASTGSAVPVLIGLPLQGFNCTFITCASVLVARRCSADSGGRAQGLLVATQGAGGVAGSALASFLASTTAANRAGPWAGFWTAALLLALAMTALAGLLNRRVEPSEGASFKATCPIV